MKACVRACQANFDCQQHGIWDNHSCTGNGTVIMHKHNKYDIIDWPGANRKFEMNKKFDHAAAAVTAPANLNATTQRANGTFARFPFPSVRVCFIVIARTSHTDDASNERKPGQM